jgi:heme-degrading monooxygenase HmoA
MYATVTHVQLKPGAGEQGESLWREKMLPQLREVPGFKEVVVLLHPDGDRGMSVIIFENEEAMRAAREGGLADRMLAEAEPMFRAPAEQDRYQVIIHERA